MDFVISLLLGLFLIELYAWLPRISKWMLELAVRRVCLTGRDRCREEWSAAVDALPNSVSKLIHAVSYLACNAPAKINSDIFGSKCDDLDAALSNLSTAHRDCAVRLNPLRVRSLKTRLRNAVNKVEEELKAIPDLQAHGALESFQRFNQTLVATHDRASDFLEVVLIKFNEQLTEVGSSIDTATRKLKLARELMHKHAASHDLEYLLTDIKAMLDQANEAMDGDGWGDDKAFAEHQKLMDVIDDVMKDWNIEARGANRE